MNLFDLVKTHTNIADVVGQYTTLRPAGNYLKARCPFHQEKTASFTVSPHREIFYCFGCHMGGDAIAFVAKVENCSPLEAAQLLVERYQIALPDTVDTQQLSTQSKNKQTHFAACKLVATWCQEQLAKHPPALRYLQERRINPEAIERFGIGFFPAGTQPLSRLLYAAREKHLLPNDLVNAHILAKGRGSLYSPFADRIIFPIHDHMGRYCGFGGRVFKKQDTRPKYYNSQESPFFTKGELLFGLDLAKKAIQKKNRTFLVEGYTDCIAMHEHGYPETVATLGTACTIHQLTLLSRYAPRACILYDNDPAGIQAIMRLAGLCWQASLELDVVILPRNQDPASFLTSGTPLTEHIAQAQDIFSFFVATTGKQFSRKPLQEKIISIRAIMQVIATVNDSLKQDLLLQQASASLSLPFETLQRALRDHDSPEKEAPPTPKTAPPDAPPSDTYPPASPLEKRLFCAILSHEDIAQEQHEAYFLQELPPPFNEVVQRLIEGRRNGTPLDTAAILNALTPEAQSTVSKVLMEYEEPVTPAEFDALMAQLRRERWREAVRTATERIASGTAETGANNTHTAVETLMSLKGGIVPSTTPSTERSKLNSDKTRGDHD